MLDSNRLDLALEAFLICLDALPFFTARVSFSCVSACFLSAASSAAAEPPRLRRRFVFLQRALEISDARRVLCRRRLRGLGVHGAFVLEFGDARFKRVLTSLDVCERCAKLLRLASAAGLGRLPRCPSQPRSRPPPRPPRTPQPAKPPPPRARPPPQPRSPQPLSARHRSSTVADASSAARSTISNSARASGASPRAAAADSRASIRARVSSPRSSMRVRRLSVARARPRATSPSLRARCRAARRRWRARSRVGGAREPSPSPPPPPSCFAERLDLGTPLRERRLRRGVHRGEPLLPLASRTPTRLRRLDLALEAFLIRLDALPFLHRFRDLHGELSFFRVAAFELFARPRAQPLVRRQASPRFRRNVRLRRQRPIARRRVPPPRQRIRRWRRLARARFGVQFGGESRGDLLLGVRASAFAASASPSPSPRAPRSPPPVRDWSPTPAQRSPPTRPRRVSRSRLPSTGEEEHPGDADVRAGGAGSDTHR